MKRSNYLTKEEIIKKHGKRIFNAFDSWMFGQTVLVLDSGESGYYVWDLDSFLSHWTRVVDESNTEKDTASK